MVSAVGYIFDLSILIFLHDYAHLHYIIATTGGFIVGLVIQYILSDKFVFGTSKLDSKTGEISAFAGIGVIGLIILNICMWLFISVIGLNYIVAKIIATIFVYIWNFLARKSLYHN